ncbi:type I pullulanase [Bacteroides caecimuris]|mgnify:FL=1|uniref:type I pullulanase n=1 Tax=Bacteroides caecimuris TaxID=1796613 RepID=UPI00138F5AD9|nr:type I pullulanase [Bacteroides caecimuris]NDO60331.1 type I pullulanase [Bacteroides caecimuris]
MKIGNNCLAILGVTTVTTVMSCSPTKKEYTSFELYPVRMGSLTEMEYTPLATKFFLWSPTAEEVRLMLYDAGEGGHAYETVKMELGENGTWTTSVDKDLLGKYYAFNVKINDKWQGDTPGINAHAVGVNGKRAAIIDWKTTNPEGWESDRRPSLKSPADMIIYEMHHRDFSVDSTSGIKNKGKYLALTEHGTVNSGNQPTGIDHLVELGVTHVHLLPSSDYASIDETKLDENHYNWGYDPANYNVPDGSYSTDPYLPAVRVKEFKQMVQALHRAGIRVIMDVVYNHTFNTLESNFERTVPGYFYRQKEDGTLANGSGCGNETASERPMMRKFMIESVLYWIKEYHIDGFRFDLMGVHDIETMNEIRKAVSKVDSTICIYGEGWAAEAPQYPADSLAMKGNVSQMPGIAVFSDELRDGLCGPVWEKDKGAFLAGVPGGEMSVKFGIVGAIKHPQVRCDSVNYSQKPWAEQPTQMISYASCHDGLCLVDRLKASMPGATPEQLVRLDKLAQTVVFTSQGIPFIYAGEEVMRDKQGIDNSYKSPDAVNAIDWRRKTTNGDIFTYYKRLIDLRKSHPAFRMGNAEMVRKHLEFLPVEGQNLIAFRLKEHANGDSWEDIIVAFNSRTTPARLEVPVGKYTVVCKDGVIDVRGLGTQIGPEVIVPGQSALIMYK